VSEPSTDRPPTGMERGLMVEQFIGNFSSQFFMRISCT